MADVTFTPNHMPPPACYPADTNGLLDLLTTGGGLTGTIPDTAGGGVFVGSSPPPSALTNKVWYKTDGAGRPLGVYMFYNGNWRRVYTGVVYGQIQMLLVYEPGWFDPTGLGIVGGDLDGWALCNGNNGTPNLEASWPVCGAPYQNGYVSDTEGASASSGGLKGARMLTSNQLPSLQTEVHGSVVASFGNQITVLGRVSDPVYGYYPVVDGHTFAPVNGVNQQPVQFPLWIALGFVMFVGYV